MPELEVFSLGRFIFSGDEQSSPSAARRGSGWWWASGGDGHGRLGCTSWRRSLPVFCRTQCLSVKSPSSTWAKMYFSDPFPQTI